MTELNLTTSNFRNQFSLKFEYGRNTNLEAEASYKRYLYNYFRIFVGVNVENEGENSLDEIVPTAIFGIRYLTPYLFNLDLRVDSKLRPQIELSREILIIPLTFLFGEYECQAYFGLIEESPLSDQNTYRKDTTCSVGLEYLVSNTFYALSSYDNRYGAGGGITVRF